ATDATRFLAMLEVEVLVTVLLHARIDILTEGLAGCSGGLMPVLTVLLEAIIGREVIATAKPPYRLFTGFFRDEKTEIGVRSGHKGVVRMDDQGYPHGLKGASRQLWARR